MKSQIYDLITQTYNFANFDNINTEMLRDKYNELTISTQKLISPTQR